MSIELMKVKLAWICKKGQLQVVRQQIEEEGSSYMTFTNTHVLVTSKHNKRLQAALDHADMVSPDGMPLVHLARKKGATCMERCAGPDQMALILEDGLKYGYTHYFYGSSQKTLDQLIHNMKSKYKGLKVVGSFSPPFRPLSDQEDQWIVNEINRLRPDCIWVGLGAPKQEIWMYDHVKRFERGVMFGVGAAFDFHAGKKSRAPVWMQKNGLEWFYRMIREPRRLFLRYLTTNTLFFYYLWKDKLLIEKCHDCYLTDSEEKFTKKLQNIEKQDIK